MNKLLKKIISFKLVILIFFASILGISIGFVWYYKLTPSVLNIKKTTTTISNKPMPEVAEEFLNKGQYPEGIDYILTYLSLHPNDPQVYKYYGIFLNGNGNYKESIENLEKALEKNTNNQLTDLDLATIYYFIGRNNDYLKQSDLAKESFQQALRLNPSCYQCYDALGMFAKKENDYENAIKYFNKALETLSGGETDSLAAYPFYNLAQVYFKLGNYKEAKEYIEKSESLSKLLTNPVPTEFLQRINNLKEAINKQNE